MRAGCSGSLMQAGRVRDGILCNRIDNVGFAELTSVSLYFTWKLSLIWHAAGPPFPSAPSPQSAGPVVLSSPAQLVAPVLVARGTLSITTTEIYFEVDEDDPAFKGVDSKVGSM